MNTRKNLFNLIVTAIFLFSCSVNSDNKNIYLMVKTTYGDITLRLYDETPIHRDNFLKLVNNHVYDGVLFHRVIKDFMIQSGDPETKQDWVRGRADTLISYTIPAEFNPALFHKKGALAAAREGNDVNPEMRSSGTQFYIVQGTKYTDNELDLSEKRTNNSIKQALFAKLIKEITDSSKIMGTNLKDSEIQEKASLRMFEILEKNGEYHLPEEHRNVYKNIGGVQRLDGTYTVFGELVEGLDVVDRIASAKTDVNDKPVADIRIVKIKRVRR